MLSTSSVSERIAAEWSLAGAGKGMHSRLYTRVLNQFPWMVNCTAISSLYNETGIFSIFALAESASADEMVNVLCKELQVRTFTHMV